MKSQELKGSSKSSDMMEEVKIATEGEDNAVDKVDATVANRPQEIVLERDERAIHSSDIDTEEHQKERSDPVQDSHEDLAVSNELNSSSSLPQSSGSKKKKKNKKSSGQTKQVKATGYEEYYADPVLTPQEYDEEQMLYSSNKSFEDRYTIALARYTNRRKMDEFRSKVFDKYMSYGGIGSGPKSFQGGIDEKSPNTTVLDTALLKSKYSISQDTLDNSVVDFDAVVRGFLTSYLHNIHEMHRKEEFKICVNVIQNWLNYLLRHNVCDEYAKQIRNAKDSCQQAEEQLPVCSELLGKLPGDFNKACSLVYGGYHGKVYIEDPETAKRLGLNPGMRKSLAQRIIWAGLSTLGTDSIFEKYNTEKAYETTTSTINDCYLEVIAVVDTSPAGKAIYSLASNHGIKPIGLLKVQTWRHPNMPVPEMTPAEVRQHRSIPYVPTVYELWIEVELFPYLVKGTKIQCTLHTTSFGIHYFDEAQYVLSPNFTWLPNEPMLEWTTPKDLPWRPKSHEQVSSKDHADEVTVGDSDNTEAVVADAVVTGNPAGLESQQTLVDAAMVDDEKNKETVTEKQKDNANDAVDTSNANDDEDLREELKKYVRGDDISISI